MKIECVGSFLPPEQLVEARKDYENGTIDLAELRRIEDRAVIGLVERQLGAGMPEVTSGELRRTYWDKDFYFGLDGISRKHIDSGRFIRRSNRPPTTCVSTVASVSIPSIRFSTISAF